MRDLAPPPRRLPPVQYNTSSSNSTRGLSMLRPTVPQMKVKPPPLPPRAVSGPVTLAEEQIEERPQLPPRPRQRRAVPSKSQSLSLTSPKLAPDTIHSSILPQHGRSLSSPIIAVRNRTPSIALRALPANSNRAQLSPLSTSSMPSPGFATSSSPTRSSESLPKTPTSWLGCTSPPFSKAAEASSCKIEEDLETMSLQRRGGESRGFIP